MNGQDALTFERKPTAQQPLLGQTLLLVEDSRYTCDALRLLSISSGARLRRADSLASARRHLTLYQPTVVIIDFGLPDGSGVELVGQLSRASAPIDVILGISGDLAAEPKMRAAGAHGFMGKPIESLAVFQETILQCLPDRPLHSVAHSRADPTISPDQLALQDDLARAVVLLSKDSDPATLRYVAPFIAGLACSAHDRLLEEAARALSADTDSVNTRVKVSKLHNLMCDRLDIRQVV